MDHLKWNRIYLTKEEIMNLAKEKDISSSFFKLEDSKEVAEAIVKHIEEINKDNNGSSRIE